MAEVDDDIESELSEDEALEEIEDETDEKNEEDATDVDEESIDDVGVTETELTDGNMTEGEITEDELSDDESEDEKVESTSSSRRIAAPAASKKEAANSKTVIRRLKNYITVLPPSNKVVPDPSKIISVVNEYQTTRNIISYTEKAKLIATRAGQIEAGSAPFVSIEGKLTATEIAELEWKTQNFPLSVMREIAAKNEMRDGELVTVIYYEIIDPSCCIIP